MSQSQIRLQWDPDHDPSGHAIQRRVIQLGIKGATAEKYAKDWILDIEDITEFVHQQRIRLNTDGKESLIVPKEEVYTVQDQALIKTLFLQDHQTPL